MRNKENNTNIFRLRKGFKSYILLFICLICLLLIGCTYDKESEIAYKEIGGFSDIVSLPEGFKSDLRLYDSSMAPKDYSKSDSSSEITDPSEEKNIDIPNTLNYYGIPYGYFYNKKEAGQLTASVFFDNDKYAYWKSLLTKGQNENENGLFQEYANKYAFETSNRVKVSIPGVKGAKVEFADGSFKTQTDANGVGYLFTDTTNDEYKINVTYVNTNQESVTKEYTVKKDFDNVIDIKDATEANNQIEIMFMVDTTGSMSDEIEFLKLELADVISKVKESNPNVQILVGLLFYRDFGDDYVTRYFDFTKDIDSQLENLKKQFSDGGGDFEEAVYKAYEEALEKQWSNTSSTKLLVHVADAPSHDEDVEKWNNSIKSLTSKGIKVITIASSGIDKKTEYFFRCQSLISGGAYVYITDDSGIGGSHIEATVDEKQIVEYLNALLIRLINGYHNGDFGTPVPYSGDVKKSDFPEEMPQDFMFEISWGKDLSCKYSSQTGALELTDGTQKTNKEKKLTEEDLKKIYQTLRNFNFKEINEYSDNVNTTDGNTIVMRVKYNDFDYTAYLTIEDKLINEKTDYYFFIAFTCVYTYVTNPGISIDPTIEPYVDEGLKSK